MKISKIIYKILNEKLKFLFILTGFLSLQAQTIETKGSVKDSLSQPLVYANVFAVPQDKEVNIAFATTNEDGKYQLKIQKNKKYEVTTSYLGFMSKKVVFNFAKDTIYNFVLKENPNQLAEVEIKYTIPVMVKKDTITYNVNSFATGNERKLQDVLKKLPGVEVDRKGNVLANGKKVTTLLVEDKPFFGGNTKLGVQNIPADAIDKIQVLENYNAISMLKGLQDNDKVALNIKLKEKKKNFIFGDIEFGAGVTDKYLTHPKLFYYSPKTSVNFIGDVNNTGKKSFTIKDYLNFEGGISKLFTDSGSYFKLYRSDFANYLNNQNYKDNKTLFGAFNLRQSVSKSTDLSMYIISAKAETLTQNSNTNQYIYNTPFTEYRNNTNNATNFYTIGKLSIDYDPSKKTDYTFSSNIKLSDNKSIGTVLTNSPTTNYNIETISNLDAFSFKQDLSLNNNLSKKHTLTFNANYTYQKDKPNLQWNTNQELLENIIPITVADYYQIRQDKNVKLQNINAVLKDYWSLHRFHHVYTSLGITNANTNFYNKDWQLLEDNNINDFSTSNFGNDLDYHFLDTYLGLEYKFKIGKATFKPAVFYHNYHWSTQQKNEEKQSFSKNLFLPQFTTKVTFRSSEKLNFKYRLKANFSSVKMLSNNYILSSFNRVFKGDSNLDNSLYHTLSVSYYKFNLYKGYNITFGVNYNKKIKSIKNVSQLEDINQFSTYTMFEEPETNWSVNGMYSKKIKKVKATLKTRYRYNDYYQLVNNNQSQNKSNTTSITPSIKTIFKKYPNIEIGYKKDFTTYHNTNITKYTNERLFSYLDYDYKDFIFEVDFEYNSYQNKTDNSINNDYINANASIFYQQENSPWGFEVNASNLFDVQYKQSNSQSDFIIADSKTYILPRIVMLKIVYKL
jgi:hypothetical protein